MIVIAAFLPITSGMNGAHAAMGLRAGCAAVALDTLLAAGASGCSRLFHTVLRNVTQQVMCEVRGPVLVSAKPVAHSACERSAT